MSDIRHTVELLGEFSKPEGFKYLTHRFDDTNDFFSIVNRCRMELAKYHRMLPQNLFGLIYGFLYGPEWTDGDGIPHTEYCSCDKWVDWCLRNPGIHPMDAFSEQFESFRNSIRVYNGTLDEYMQDRADSGLYPDIEIEVDDDSLSNFDAYVDVQTLHKMIKSIMQELNDYQKISSHPDIRVFCTKREKLEDGTCLDTICIENVGSFPSQDKLQAKSHFENGGGFLSTLKKMAEGNMLLSVETAWDGEPCRWNILRMDGEDEFVPLDQDAVTGFRYKLRILHKS